jgi:hypothetical protein
MNQRVSKRSPIKDRTIAGKRIMYCCSRVPQDHSDNGISHQVNARKLLEKH